MQRAEVPEAWNELTSRIIAAAMEVHSRLGPGQLEKIYERAMVIELKHRGLNPAQQVPVRVSYRGESLGELVLDLVVSDLVVVELKAVVAVADVHLAQLTSYLRLADYPLGLLINFNCALLKDSISRRINSRSTRFSSALSAQPSGSSAFS